MTPPLRALDRAFPFRGPCGICGGPDARHRLWDALDGGARSSDGIKVTARSYQVSVSQVRLVVRAYADARRRHVALPGRRAA